MIINPEGKVLVDTVLEHHGVKGMKWGVRKRRAMAKTHAQQGKKNKHPSHFSDEELKALVARMKLEQDYHNLTKKPDTKGKKFAQDMLVMTGQMVIKGAVKSAIDKATSGTMPKKDTERNTNHLTEMATRSIVNTPTYQQNHGGKKSKKKKAPKYPQSPSSNHWRTVTVQDGPKGGFS